MSSRERRPHEPVLAAELVAGLDVKAGGRYVDCTLGAGGHAMAVLAASAPSGRLLGIDTDESALTLATKCLQAQAPSLQTVRGNFADVRDISTSKDFLDVDGVYFDLGLSSMQLDSADRGFSFSMEGPLDMRFSARQSMTGRDVVNSYPVDQLAGVLWKYGEERKSRTIARRIVARRPVETTTELASIVAAAYPKGHHRIHPATRTFQALRMCVNDELKSIEEALRGTVDVLKPAGRVAVISYHSLEDRIVKRWFRDESASFVHVPNAPGGGHERVPSLEVITRRIIRPSKVEVTRNPRSRSAKLRIAKKADKSQEHRPEA